MASIRKRGKKWFVEVRLKTGYRSKSFDTKLEAQAWGIEQTQLLSRNVKLIKGKTVADAFIRYGQEVSPSKKTERNELNRLKKLKRAPFASILLDDLQTDDINEWVRDELKRIKNSSVNRDLTLISSVIETARKQWKWISSNPVRDAYRPKNPRLC